MYPYRFIYICMHAYVDITYLCYLYIYTYAYLLCIYLPVSCDHRQPRTANEQTSLSVSGYFSTGFSSSYIDADRLIWTSDCFRPYCFIFLKSRKWNNECMTPIVGNTRFKKLMRNVKSIQRNGKQWLSSFCGLKLAGGVPSRRKRAQRSLAYSTGTIGTIV